MNESFLLWLIATMFLLIAAVYCDELERDSRGKGSWYRDRELLGVRGAALALALVSFGLAIASLFPT